MECGKQYEVVFEMKILACIISVGIVEHETTVE
jgi:hypothetical protein